MEGSVCGPTVVARRVGNIVGRFLRGRSFLNMKGCRIRHPFLKPVIFGRALNCFWHSVKMLLESFFFFLLSKNNLPPCCSSQNVTKIIFLKKAPILDFNFVRITMSLKGIWLYGCFFLSFYLFPRSISLTPFNGVKSVKEKIVGGLVFLLEAYTGKVGSL